MSEPGAVASLRARVNAPSVDSRRIFLSPTAAPGEGGRGGGRDTAVPGLASGGVPWGGRAGGGGERGDGSGSDARSCCGALRQRGVEAGGGDGGRGDGGTEDVGPRERHPPRRMERVRSWRRGLAGAHRVTAPVRWVARPLDYPGAERRSQAAGLLAGTRGRCDRAQCRDSFFFFCCRRPADAGFVHLLAGVLLHPLMAGTGPEEA